MKSNFLYPFKDNEKYVIFKNDNIDYKEKEFIPTSLKDQYFGVEFKNKNVYLKIPSFNEKKYNYVRN